MAENNRRQQDFSQSSRDRDERQWRDSDYENRGRGYSSQLPEDRRYESDSREQRGQDHYGNYGGSYSSDYDRGRYNQQSDRYGSSNRESSPPYGFDPDESRSRYGRQSWESGPRGYSSERGYGAERGYGGYSSQYMGGRPERGYAEPDYDSRYARDEWREPEYSSRHDYLRTRYERGWEPEYRSDRSRWEPDYSTRRENWEPSYGQGRRERDYTYGEGVMGQGIYGNTYGQGRQSSSYGNRNLGTDWGNQGTQRNNRGRGPIGYRRSDERITEDINDRLSDDTWLDATNIEVKVNDGEVVLSGTVDSREDKRRAEDLAEQVSGIANVENHLRVERSNSSSSSSSTRRSNNTNSSSSTDNESSRSKSNKSATTTG